LNITKPPIQRTNSTNARMRNINPSFFSFLEPWEIDYYWA
jgi:hypothetical protein